MNIDRQSILLRNNDIVFSEIDGETVMMDANFENYFGLDSIGTRVWQLLEEEISFGQLCEKLLNEYDVNQETCLNDVVPFVQHLAEQEMIHIR